MPRTPLPAPLQYSLIAALFALLLWGLLVPGGNARAGALGAPVAGTPVGPGTLLATRPAPPVSVVPPSVSAPAREVAPVTTLVRSSNAPIATPATGGSAVAATPIIPLLPGTRVPTATPTGKVSAAVTRELTPLGLTLNGRDQVAQTTLIVGVDDSARAAWQPGWTLTLSVAQFRIADNADRVLPADAVTLLGVTVVCADGAECTMPDNTITYPLLMPAGAAVPILAAAPGSGSGRFVITPTFAVKVLGDAYAGRYTTAIAVDIMR